MTPCGRNAAREGKLPFPAVLALAVFPVLAACTPAERPGPADFSPFWDRPQPLETSRRLIQSPPSRGNDPMPKVNDPAKRLGTADFSRFRDRALPAETARWLMPGPQSQANDLILQASRKIDGRNRRERLYQAVEYVWTNFRYDNWLNDQMFQRTAARMFEDGILGGCSDFALVMVALFRAVGIPARLVLTANADWLKKYRANPLAIVNGHVFIEVFLEDHWHLADPTYRKLFIGYEIANPFYPRGELFCLRGVDYWSLGLESVEQLNRTYARITASSIPERYRDPNYAVHEL